MPAIEAFQQVLQKFEEKSSPTQNQSLDIRLLSYKRGTMTHYVALVGEVHIDNSMYYGEVAALLEEACNLFHAGLFIEFAPNHASRAVEESRLEQGRTFAMEEAMHKTFVDRLWNNREKSGGNKCRFNLVDVRTTIFGRKLQDIFGFSWFARNLKAFSDAARNHDAPYILGLLTDVYMHIYESARPFFTNALDASSHFHIFERALLKIKDKHWKQQLQERLTAVRTSLRVGLEEMLLQLASLKKYVAKKYVANTKIDDPKKLLHKFAAILHPLFVWRTTETHGELLWQIHHLIDIYFVMRLARDRNEFNLLYIGKAHVPMIHELLRDLGCQDEPLQSATDVVNNDLRRTILAFEKHEEAK